MTDITSSSPTTILRSPSRVLSTANPSLPNWPAALARTAGSFSTGEEGLAAAYKLSDSITRQHSKSFYFSSWLLPPDKRRAIRALYAFCRTADDFVDRPDTAQDCAECIHRWRLLSHRGRDEQVDPVLLAWADTREQYQVPRRYAEELLDGVEMDLTTHRYATFEDLKLYCYRVAATVGLMSMHIVGASGRDSQVMVQAEPYAIQLGIALQLTNILRDVGEDAANGRIYLPLDDLSQFGCTEEDILAGRLTENLRRLLQFEINRAHQLYEASWPGIALLHPNGRLAVAAAAILYRRILDKIVQNEYDVFHRRAHVPGPEKLRLLPAIWWQVRKLG